MQADSVVTGNQGQTQRINTVVHSIDCQALMCTLYNPYYDKHIRKYLYFPLVIKQFKNLF